MGIKKSPGKKESTNTKMSPRKTKATRKKDPKISSSGVPKEKYTKPGLTEKESAYCRCILHVQSKAKSGCKKSNWGQSGCYNPYAVCSSKVGTSSRKCGSSYVWENIPIDEIKGYMDMNSISYCNTDDKSILVQKIRGWKKEKYDE